MYCSSRNIANHIRHRPSHRRDLERLPSKNLCVHRLAYSRITNSHLVEIKDSLIVPDSEDTFTTLAELIAKLQEDGHKLCFVALRYPLAVKTKDGREFVDDKFGLLVHKPKTATHNDNFTYLKGKEELERVSDEEFKKNKKSVEFVIKDMTTYGDDDFEEEEFQESILDAFGWSAKV
jgi:hypothetical protein